MSVKKACSTCRFSAYEDGMLECRRHAPIKLHGVGTGYEEKMFPVVSEDTWCGEWEYFAQKEEQK